MRIFIAFAMLLGLIISANSAVAETLSGASLKTKLQDTTVILSKSGRKVKRRMELTLHKNGSGGSLHVPSGQVLKLTWKVKGRDLCLTQKKDGKEFCMLTQVSGNTISAQMPASGGKTRKLKGTITPF